MSGIRDSKDITLPLDRVARLKAATGPRARWKVQATSADKTRSSSNISTDRDTVQLCKTRTLLSVSTLCCSPELTTVSGWRTVRLPPRNFATVLLSCVLIRH